MNSAKQGLRVVPEHRHSLSMVLERRACVPPDGVPIVPWFDGSFSRAFIVLHPFVVVDGLDPASCERGNVHLNAGDRPEDLDFIEWVERERRAQPRGKEIRFGASQDIVKRFGKPIRWSTICQQLNLADHRDLDRALRTHIGGLKRQFRDQVTAERLNEHCAASGIFPPTEGSFQAVLEPPLADLLSQIGVKSLILGDEFGEDVYSVKAEELKAGESWSKAQPRRIVAKDHSVLVLTPWDSFFTIIVGSDRLLTAALPDLFEGFWCAKKTTTDWCFEPYIPLAR